MFNNRKTIQNLKYLKAQDEAPAIEKNKQKQTKKR